jgi:hypothetical protein
MRFQLSGQSLREYLYRLMPPATAFIIVVLGIGLVACATPQQRKAVEDATLQREASREINRVCSLPEAERAAEIEAIKAESGMVVLCGKE